jgi:hypothetical protein
MYDTQTQSQYTGVNVTNGCDNHHNVGYVENPLFQ